MSITAPKLDDRQFQDIVDETKKRIALYCPEWTDHNVSDPGVTLLELFAWMTDIIVYRLNQVPELHYRRFMEMFGVKLQEPTPARCDVTFWLSAPPEDPIVIPAGTEISTTQTEAMEPVIFAADHDFEVQIPDRQVICRRTISDGGRPRELSIRRLMIGVDEKNAVSVFSDNPPQVNDAFYFGFANDLSNHILRFDFDFQRAIGASMNPYFPPYVWEASTGESEKRWVQCEVDYDATQGMNISGRIQIHLPQIGRHPIGDKDLFWIRVRIKNIGDMEKEDGMTPYSKSPKLLRINAVGSMGGTTHVTHANIVENEPLGISSGEPNQRFQLQNAPLLSRSSEEHLRVQIENEPDQIWREKKDFASSEALDQHYTLDGLTGELRFGPTVRKPNGEMKQYGATPKRGARLRFERYRYGGGLIGNVEPRALNTLKTAIPYVDRVTNRKAAWGGTDPETIEEAMTRMPGLLRSRERAVTEDDYEFLARQAFPNEIERIKCIQPTPDESKNAVPGQLHVVLIPKLRHPEGYLTVDQLRVDRAQRDKIKAYLDERRLLTARLNVSDPEYHWVVVQVSLRITSGSKEEVVQEEVLRRLYRFLNPLAGGPDGRGWPFGRDLFVADVYRCLQDTPNVLFLRELKMFEATEDGEIQGESVETIDIVRHGVIASGLHRIEFV